MVSSLRVVRTAHAAPEDRGPPFRAIFAAVQCSLRLTARSERAYQTTIEFRILWGGQMSQPIRVLLAKVGLDGHDRGVRVVARTLRDAGMDVIYSGLHRTPEEVVTAAIQEDVDILGVSLLSGVQLTVFPKIFKLLAEQEAQDLIVVAGGVMPDEDVVAIKEMGVREVLLQDTPPNVIVETLRRLVAERGER
jgi:methylmalonyl-CoA mutase cobalamin-binding domain/chain